MDILMGVDADNHLLRLGLAVGHRCLLGLRSAGWPGWADRTVTGRECGRPLLGHGPSGQLLDDAPVSDDRQFSRQDRRSVKLWVRPSPTGTHCGMIEDLELFTYKIGVDVDPLLEHIGEARDRFIEDEENYADYMQDELKEQWREERASERNVSDMFDSLRDDRE